MTFEIEEGQRQGIICALARLRTERPGWDYFLGEIAKAFGGEEMYQGLVKLYSTRNASELLTALEESVKLQSHYAALLNMHDGGARIGFESASAWIERLRETGTLPK